MPRRNKGKRVRALKEPKLGSQLEGKGLKAKGPQLKEPRVEEPGDTAHQFLCTKEVGTPKASLNWGISVQELSPS